jgi:ABC-type phosphate transport system ATPase subunit
MSVMMVVISLERISTPLLAVSKAMVAACEFFTVIDAPRPETGNLKEPEVSATNDIVFNDVTFAYPSRPHVKVLDGLDLTIEAGKLTAIVGPSGSGKSTIVGLVQRWYTLQDQYVIAKTIEKEKKKKSKKGKENESDDEHAEPAPEETGPAVELHGSVTTSSHLINDIDLKWWRSQIGLVQQEPFLFNDTIFKNVAYGLVGSQWEDENEDKKRELVKEACKEAFADEFIDRLPDVSGLSHRNIGDFLLTEIDRVTTLRSVIAALSCQAAKDNGWQLPAVLSESRKSLFSMRLRVPSTSEVNESFKPLSTKPLRTEPLSRLPTVSPPSRKRIKSLSCRRDESSRQGPMKVFFKMKMVCTTVLCTHNNFR